MRLVAGYPEFFHRRAARQGGRRIARARARGTLTAIGLAMPPQRITINLSPADLPKAGSHYDLPIALALMAALELIPGEETDGHVALGELSLDGEIRAVQGALPAAIAAAAQDKGLICPRACGSEAAGVGAAEVLAPASLIDLVNHFAGRKALTPPEPGPVAVRRSVADLIDVKGQESARRALEVAAAGGHHILVVGEPGSGKSMLASRLTGIMPPLSPEEALEVSTIYSLAAQARRRHHLQGTALPGAAPLGLDGGDDRRRQGRETRRDLTGAPRRLVPRRVARVQATSARSFTSTCRRGVYHDQPGAVQCRVSGAFHAIG